MSAVVGKAIVDYIPHHNWFQYFASTANPTHARPSSRGRDRLQLWKHDGKTRDPANHEYDLQDFYAAVKAGNFPPCRSSSCRPTRTAMPATPIRWMSRTARVALINFLQQQPDWKNTAVIITWDDSDGWYDHAFAKPTSASFDPQADQLDGPGKCGSGTPTTGVDGKPVNGRCGPGTRIPFLVISPWARPNYVDHHLISQASVVRFIEDNWLHGERLGGGSFDASAGSITGHVRLQAAQAGCAAVPRSADRRADHDDGDELRACGQRGRRRGSPPS